MNHDGTESVNLNNIGFFKKLVSGDFGLAKTYWMYSVLAGFIANIFIKNVQSDIAVAMILLLHGIYQAVVLIGTWKASNKYNGKKIWAILAKIAVVLGGILLLFTLLIITLLIY